MNKRHSAMKESNNYPFSYNKMIAFAILYEKQFLVHRFKIIPY